VPDSDIDAYIDGLEEPKRTTLGHLRTTIMTFIPDAEQCLSYGMPAFKVRGKTVAGFAAFKSHLSYLPHSGSVLPRLATQLDQYSWTPGSLHFPIEEPLPAPLVQKLISVRMAEAFDASAGEPIG
jgi:uncharacterized protein YdhG (YjbR/CyaY superfamily)